MPKSYSPAPRAHSLEFRVERGEGDPSGALRLVLRPTRSLVRRIVILHGTKENPLIGLSDLEFQWQPPAGFAGAEVGVRIDYEGEPVRVESVRWLSDSERPLPAGTSYENWARLRREALSAWRQHAARIPAEDTGAVLSDSERDRAVAFFTELDLQTHPRLIDTTQSWAAQRIIDVTSVGGTLLDRLRLRLSLVDASPPRVPPPAQLKSADPAQVKRLAGVMSCLLRKYFTDGQGGYRRQLVLLAFEAFATGTLGSCSYDGKSHTWSAEPDSTNLLLFGEFAQLCLDQSVPRSAVWTWLVRVFTAIQPLYLEAYSYKGIGCVPPSIESPPKFALSWQTRGPPCRTTDRLKSKHWREHVRELHFKRTAHLPLLLAQHVADASPGGIDA